MFRYLILSASLIITSLFANTECSDVYINDVCEYAKTAVLKVDGDRVYINPTRIFGSGEDLFLISDYREAIPISFLFSSPSGLYMSSVQYKGTPWWMCKKCGRRHKTEPSACLTCGGTNFLIVYY